jgi:hypothetical protein
MSSGTGQSTSASVSGIAMTINGQPLTEAEVMTIRAALAGMNFDCGTDEHGKKMEAAYRATAYGLLAMMVTR